MLFALISTALANTPSLSTFFESRTIDEKKTVNTGLHLGVDLRGWHPGIGARLDFGHRVSASGTVFSGVPRADDMKWTGGATLGLELAPLKLRVGTQGTLDLRVGAGGLFQTGGTAQLEGGGFDISEWASGTLEWSPNGAWSLYGGLFGRDLMADDRAIEPRGGVRFKLE